MRVGKSVSVFVTFFFFFTIRKTGKETSNKRILPVCYETSMWWHTLEPSQGHIRGVAFVYFFHSTPATSLNA